MGAIAQLSFCWLLICCWTARVINWTRRNKRKKHIGMRTIGQIKNEKKEAKRLAATCTCVRYGFLSTIGDWTKATSRTVILHAFKLSNVDQYNDDDVNLWFGIAIALVRWSHSWRTSKIRQPALLTTMVKVSRTYRSYGEPACKQSEPHLCCVRSSKRRRCDGRAKVLWCPFKEGI